MSLSYSPTPSQEGAAFPWILDHILSYPGSYEIPLRTMYTLNSSPRAQPPLNYGSRPGSPRFGVPISPSKTSRARSPTVLVAAPAEQQQAATNAATAQFKSSLMTQISQLPAQPCSLPPSFLTSFVRRCFPAELTLVDFPQALTGLDYLRDLEMRRRKEIAAAMRRLGVDRENHGTHGQPALDDWVKSLEDKERKVEAFYSQCYIGLRRWILINEMSLLPFNKSNCLAMLNTLYPPSHTSQPTPQLTVAILNAQRNGFFRYIQGVEKNGPRILENLVQQGRRPEKGEENGWYSVRESVENHLRAANAMIDECSAITDIESLLPVNESEDKRRKGRKVDSGVSFATDDRPSTGSSSTHLKDKSIPPRSPSSMTAGRGGSTLERITREIRRMRERKKVEEGHRKDEKPKTKLLKKMKSTNALDDHRDRT
ncbi:hypothetical protein FGG08_003485 [Glutinoglossum americanum]|uniref:Uncharacterized protein n=1 Tax=Glutinoglossum americanum TaxID=1670608 RepID=A0A9P8ID81_9PEZI|nr:hypothetical protein FGG08_003485 [Glutinoglossum americanum]